MANRAPPIDRALRKASLRLTPLLLLGYVVGYIDRLNISFAASQMNADLKFSAAAYGVGASLFFLGYALLEAPSNLILVRIGARRWIARILITWGLLSACTLLVRTPLQFWLVRLALGSAEAGFFPGVLYFLSTWFPADQRGRAISRFYIGYPLATLVMGAASGAILRLDGLFRLRGWQWLFLVEGAPAVLVGLAILFFLTDSPQSAQWLTAEERQALVDRLDPPSPRHGLVETLSVLKSPRLWLLGLGLMLSFLALTAVSFSAPSILAKSTGMDLAQVGYLVAATGVMGIGTMLGVGWWADRTRRRHLIAASSPLILGAGYAALALAPGAISAIAAFSLTQFSSYLLQGVYWTLPSRISSGPRLALVYAALNTLGQIGSFFGPVSFGLLRDATGSYTLGFLVLIAPLILSCAALYFGGRETRPDPCVPQALGRARS